MSSHSNVPFCVRSSATSSPRVKRKRVRSLTPSEISVRIDGDADVLRSPLAKRKKLAADRSGASPLKEAFTAEQLQVASRRTSEDLSVKGSRPASPMNGVGDDDDENTDDDDDASEVNMIDDDFLARELEEEWG